MSFKYKGNLNGGHNRTLIKVFLGSQSTFRVGDVVTLPAAVTEDVFQATAGIRVMGVIAAVITDGGVSPSSDGCSGAFVNKYYTPATNYSTTKISALIDIDPNSLYSADLDDTIGTTTGSNKKFYMFDVVGATTGTTASKLDENTASATSGQFFSFGLDTDDTNRVIVKIKESFLLGDSGY